jgi:hypothetical protein
VTHTCGHALNPKRVWYGLLGMVIQHILCLHFHSKKIAIFSTDDSYGTKASMESGDGTYCDLNVLYKVAFRSDTTDFSKIIADAKYSGLLVTA